MLVALAVASVAAPLTSGSAIALTGPSDTAAAPAAVKAAKPGTFKIHRSGVVRKRSGHECHRGDKGQGSGSSATMPLM
jgi:hypothetical protein